MKIPKLAINWSDRTIVTDDNGKTQVVAHGFGTGPEADNMLRWLAASATFAAAIQEIANLSSKTPEAYVADADAICIDTITNFEVTLS